MIEQLQEALKTDEGYRIGWQANIAMAFVDAYKSALEAEDGHHPDVDIHEVANKAADNFLNTLCQ